MKDWLKRISPSKSEISNHKHMRVFGDWLHDPNLWHLNRRSVAGAFAVGLFFMYMPPFFQMVQAGFAAIFLRVNLPISAALVWITNPITIPPMYYFAYVLGCWVLAKPPAPFDLDFWLNWHNWLEILAPLSLGSLDRGPVAMEPGATDPKAQGTVAKQPARSEPGATAGGPPRQARDLAPLILIVTLLMGADRGG